MWRCPGPWRLPKFISVGDRVSFWPVVVICKFFFVFSSVLFLETREIELYVSLECRSSFVVIVVVNVVVIVLVMLTMVKPYICVV